MNKYLAWFLRGGIAAALGVLILSIWPARVIEHSQDFGLQAADPVQAEIRFRAPEQIYRGAQADFSVLLDLGAASLINNDVHPVMIYRLEMPGAQITPDAVFQIPLASVLHQEARWRVRFPESGTYDGTWWVYVEYVGQGGEIIDRQALFARRFSVESRGILGLPVTGTRWVSMLVIFMGLGIEIWSILRQKSVQ